LLRGARITKKGEDLERGEGETFPIWCLMGKKKKQGELSWGAVMLVSMKRGETVGEVGEKEGLALLRRGGGRKDLTREKTPPGEKRE